MRSRGQSLIASQEALKRREYWTRVRWLGAQDSGKRRKTLHLAVEFSFNGSFCFDDSLCAVISW